VNAPAPERRAVAQQDRWNLSVLYPSNEAWEADFERLSQDIPSLSDFKGRLVEGPAVLLDYLQKSVELSLRRERLVEFANRSSDVDLADGDALARRQRAMGLSNQLEEESAFFRPELMALPEPAIQAAFDAPALAPYKNLLERLLWERKYTLSEPEERLLALSAEVCRSPVETFEQLNAADLVLGEFEHDGEVVVLSHGNALTYWSNANREVRRKAFDTYYQGYAGHKHTLAATLAGGLRSNVFRARARGFDSSLQAALYSEKIPESVYHNLIETTHEYLGPFYDYLELLRSTLKLDTVHAYDLFAPLVPNVKLGRSYEAGVDLTLEAVSVLGEEYVSTLRNGLLNGWVDRYHNKNKVPGAYSGGAYGSDPFILLNFKDDNIEHVYTLAHEAGHSMHTSYANRAQTYQDAHYSIFVAEVASTFNETLLTEHLLKTLDDPLARAELLARELSALRTVLYRQTMFAEFELAAHRRVEENLSLTLDDLRQLYRSLLERYFGPKYVIDEASELECLRIPHFYYGYYVYQYSTGVSAALALAEQVLHGGQPAADRYLKFLATGNSLYPTDALEVAGVDMTQSAPVQAAYRYFARRLSELRAALAAL